MHLRTTKRGCKSFTASFNIYGGKPMLLFLSDLDNTLIYSYKKDIGKEKFLVETKDGKELSFMTKNSAFMLSELQKKLQFIPVTTRSKDQYDRITFYPHWKPEYALVANGGILLHQGKIVDTWYENSLEYIQETQAQLEHSLTLLSQDLHITLQGRKVDGLFIFAKSSCPSKTIGLLENALDLSLIQVYQNGQKVYVFPKILNKGLAAKRIKEYFHPNYVFAAGDSIFDVPMLKQCDFSFLPKNLEKYWENTTSNQIIAKDDDIFSEIILEHILNTLKTML